MSGSTDAVIGVSGTYTVTITPMMNRIRRIRWRSPIAGATLTGAGTLTVATTLDNAGIIDATGCNVLNVETNTLINEYSGVIAALDGGDLTITEQTDSTNYGLIKAANGGTLTIDHDGTATNEVAPPSKPLTTAHLILNNNLGRRERRPDESRRRRIDHY